MFIPDAHDDFVHLTQLSIHEYIEWIKRLIIPNTLDDLIHLGAVVFRNVLFFLLCKVTASESLEVGHSEPTNCVPGINILPKTKISLVLGWVHLLCLLCFFCSVLVGDLVECWRRKSCLQRIQITYKYPDYL